MDIFPLAKRQFHWDMKALSLLKVLYQVTLQTFQLTDAYQVHVPQMEAVQCIFSNGG